MYLDDMLMMLQSSDVIVQERAKETTHLDNIAPGVTGICSQLRQVPATTNSNLQYLGFLVNSREMKIRLTEEKVV